MRRQQARAKEWPRRKVERACSFVVHAPPRRVFTLFGRGALDVDDGEINCNAASDHLHRFAGDGCECRSKALVASRDFGEAPRERGDMDATRKADGSPDCIYARAGTQRFQHIVGHGPELFRVYAR